jgi:hypothetical protein
MAADPGSAPQTRPGKVVVNRAMSLDGFAVGPDDAMDWTFEHITPDFPVAASCAG